MQKTITSYTMEARRQAKAESRSFGFAELALEDMIVTFRRAYESTDAYFVGTIVPALWYLDAEEVFIKCCKRSAEEMLKRGFYDKDTSRLTKSGEQNWDELYQARISTENSIRSTLAVVRKRDNSPPQKDCPPCLECIPPEMIDKILDYALNASSSGSQSEYTPGLLIANKFLREHSLSWLSRQVVTIRARSWPRKPRREFDRSNLPVKWLQKLRKVRFDFDGISFYERAQTHPVMEQIAEVWKTENNLESLTLTIHPDFDKLKLGELAHGPGVDRTYQPILQIRQLEKKLDYAYDFGAPVSIYNLPALHMIFEWRHYSEQALKFILEKSSGFINQRDATGKTPLHKAVLSELDCAVKVLLSVEGIDVNLPDFKGNTALDCALDLDYYSIASSMLEHKNLNVTPITISRQHTRASTRRQTGYGEVHWFTVELCVRLGSVPRSVQRRLSQTQIAILYENNCKFLER